MPTKPVVEVVLTAYVGRTHRPCGACGKLVWLEEGCRHIRVTAEARRVTAARAQAAEYQAAARARAKRDVAAFLRTL